MSTIPATSGSSSWRSCCRRVLLALDMKTGKIVASLPVLDDLPEGYQVAVENSAIVYDDSEGTVSTIVCNWFGAGNAGLADPNNDSSI